MDFVDSKYIGLISNRLENFKKVKSNLYNFRCPLCGDSKKYKSRARGFFYSVKNNANFKCHNCGASISFNNFLKSFDVVLHQEYIFEKFKVGHTGKNFTVETPKFEFNKPVFTVKLDLPKASEVKISKEYLESRKINPNYFYFAHNFKKWANSKKHTFKDISKDEGRIVIPLYDFDKNLIGFQGRSIGPSLNKYITVMLLDGVPKIYGLDKIDSSKTIYVVEGPFDSTFVKNSIAMCGSDVDLSMYDWKDYVYVFDNEPRNIEIVNRISKVIDKGEKVVIWDSDILEKDINDMILHEIDVERILKQNIYQGLEAKLKFTNWKKV